MSHPIFNNVKWDLLPPQEESGDGIPYATHEGILEIVGKKLRCYRLSNGQAVIHADDMRELFGDLLPENPA